MTRPTFPDHALLSPRLPSSGPSSPRSPISPRFKKNIESHDDSRRNSTGSGLSEREQHGQEEMEMPELAHPPSNAAVHELEDDDDEITEQQREAGTQEVMQEAPCIETGKFSTISSTIEGDGLWPSFQRMWIKHVSIRVDTAQRRDHLALERTFLGYLRTSLALSFTGVTIAQLLRLDSILSSPSEPTPYHAIGGVALAASFMIGSIVTVLAGAVRFWRQQVAMAEGKCWAGGPELVCIWMVFAALGIAMFVVLLVQPKPDD